SDTRGDVLAEVRRDPVADRCVHALGVERAHALIALLVADLAPDGDAHGGRGERGGDGGGTFVKGGAGGAGEAPAAGRGGPTSRRRRWPRRRRTSGRRSSGSRRAVSRAPPWTSRRSSRCRWCRYRCTGPVSPDGSSLLWSASVPSGSRSR